MYEHLTAKDSGRAVIIGTGGAPLQNVSTLPGAFAFYGYAMIDQLTNGNLQVSVYDSSSDLLMQRWSVGPNP
jgi:hypothetical protein